MRALLVLIVLCAGCTSDDSATRPIQYVVTDGGAPRVTLPDRPGAERRVNASLDSLWGSFHCEGLDGDTAGTMFDVMSGVVFARADVLSVSVHTSYLCGGPYPTYNANRSVTYDVATGRAVPFEALWRDYDADREALLGLFASTLHVGPFVRDPDIDCRDVLTPERLAESGFGYALLDEGLMIQPQLPHVVVACSNEVMIPYGSVRAFAADGGVLARAADASS